VIGPLVLNTRPAEQASELSSLLRTAGFGVVEAPAIAIVPDWDAAVFRSVRRDLQHGVFDWIIVASQNAGHALEDDLRAAGGRVVCGAATAHALRLDSALVVKRFSAAAALETLRPLVSRGQRVLVPRAAEGRVELLDGLRALDVEVVAPVAYRTLPVRAAADRLRQGGIDVVVLCSPSAATSVIDSIPLETMVVCLGDTTAAAVRAHGRAVNAVATRSTMAAVVEATGALRRVGV
jgi:uroporphyrinogen-III synthase